MHRHVAVNENDDFSGAGAHSTIAGRRGSQWTTCDANNFAAMRARHRRRVVVGTVIHHDDLIRFSSRSPERLKTVLQMRAAVPHRNDNAESERRSICVRESLHRKRSRHTVRGWKRQPIVPEDWAAGILNCHLYRVDAFVSE